MSDPEIKSQLILKIHRVLNNDGYWMPAIQDVASHDIDPLWVAGVAYLIIDRYINSVEESKQNDFYEKVMNWFFKMSKYDNIAEYVEKMDLPKSMD